MCGRDLSTRELCAGINSSKTLVPFLDRFGQQAERLGWTADELFGLHPTVPMHRYDCMGMLWMLQGEPWWRSPTRWRDCQVV
jgi:hypothetical protein